MDRVLMVALMVLGAIPGGAASQARADAPASQVDGRFDVGGRAIRLACRGQGAPTVVVDAGMGTAPVEDPGWQAIADRVAPVTRICLHDRAGLGGSDPAPAGARTSLDAARDLHAALQAAGIAPPYLLAAHSIGGLHAQAFASRYPSGTAGLVLISTTHPDQIQRWLAQLPPEETDEEGAITDARTFLTRMANDPSANEERLDFRASAAQARALVSLGDKPLVVATHSPRFRMVPGLSEPLALRLEAQTQAMQRQLLGLSSNAVQNVAPEAGHGLPHEAPAFVVENILQGVAAVRAQGSEADGSTLPVGDADKLAAFNAFVKAYRTERGILSLSYAIAKDGRIVAAEGFGWQDHDAEEPTTADTSYLVASITKTFSAATLLAMEADGLVDLDDAFTDLSDWAGRCERLATSGNIFGGGVALADGYVPPKIDCSARIRVRDVLQMRVLGTPGSNFLYNPIVFGRLANWVEEKTGRPFDRWVRHYVIDRAGLPDIAAGWRDGQGAMALVHLAPPFRIARDEDDGLAPSPLPNPEMNASSGIIASARSLAAYSLALDQERILPRALLQQMWTPPVEADGTTASYAYGWWTQQWRGEQLVWHGGWWPDAYAGLLLKVPGKGLTLVALGNTDGLHWDNRLQVAEVEKNPLALKFLELFAAD